MLKEETRASLCKLTFVLLLTLLLIVEVLKGGFGKGLSPKKARNFENRVTW